MDFVYICRDGENEELRYSIRSVVKNFPGAKIWVIGGKPEWYTGPYIEVEQSRTKYTNAKNNLRAIYNTPEISESFVLMNDDFYIVNKVDSIPYMHGGLLIDKINTYEMPEQHGYAKHLVQTYNNLSRKIKTDIINYELHVPMVMEKRKLARVMLINGLWRSVYGNIYGVGGTESTDVKVYGPEITDRPSYDYESSKLDYLSSDDTSFEKLFNDVLSKMFTEKTDYELL